MKKVSVIIPAFNHAEFIADAISSALESSYENIEVVVIDDGSTDDTRKVVSSFKNVLYFHQKNLGAHHAINRGISVASGDLIAILNDDDVFSPSHVSQAVLNLETYGNSFFVGKAEVFGQGFKLELLKEHLASSVKAIEDFGWILSLFKINWSISTSSFVFDKDVYNKLGGFHGLSFCHDLDFLLRAIFIENVSVGVSDSPTWHYRCHETNTGSSINAIKQASEIVYVLGRVLNPIINDISADHMFSLIGHGLSSNIKLFAATEKPWLNESTLTVEDSIAEWIAACETSDLDLLF